MKRDQLRARDYLRHMLDAILQIQEYTRGVGPERFGADRLLQDGVARNLEILGEASRQLLQSVPDAVSRFPSIPFPAIYAMRNQLSHGYFTVDWAIVWKVVERDLPELRTGLEAAIAKLAAELEQSGT